MGILGYQPSIILDLVIIICVGLVPLLKIGIHFAKNRKTSIHKIYMTLVSLVVFILVSLFEWDMRQQGGISGLALAAGRTEAISTSGYRLLLIIHLCLAITCFFFWLGFVFWSWLRFGRIMSHGGTRKKHAMLAHSLMYIIYGVLATGYLVYYFAFIH